MTKPLHLGVLAPEFPPDLGGVETYAFELCRALAGHDIELDIFCRTHAGAEVPGARVHPLLNLDWRHDLDIIQRQPVDLWHAMNAVYGALAHSSTRPVVASVHGNDFLRPYGLRAAMPVQVPGLWRLSDRLQPLRRELGRRWIAPRLLRHELGGLQALVANSHYTANALVERHPECAERLHVAHVGVAERFFLDPIARPRETSQPAQLVTVSRLSEPRKNLDVVLRALARLKNTQAFQYRIIGDGYQRSALEQLTAQLGLTRQVEFLGRLSDAALHRELRSSDLFILCSSVVPGSHEGFGIVYLEANACGVPVLAARLAGAVEAVDEGVSGYFVDTPDEPSITGALRQFLSAELHFDPARCRAHARRFPWDAVAQRCLQIYAALLAPSKGE